MFKKKSSISPVISTISIDYLNSSYYSKNDTILVREEKPRYIKNQKTITYLSNKLFLDEVVYISKHIPEEDIQDIIETTVYDALALDMSVAYIIQYIEIFNTDDENISEDEVVNEDRKFHVFLIAKDSFHHYFSSTLHTFEYLDYIIPIPLLFKSIYSQGLLTPHGVHAFIYIQHKDAFVTLYKESEFIFTKSFKFSLEHLHKEFCELLGENLPYNDFCNMLESDGLATPDEEAQKYLLNLLGSLFSHIKKEVLPHAISINHLPKIDNVYLSSDLGNIRGLTDFSKTFLAIPSSKLNFNLGFKSKETNINLLHQLMQLYEQQIDEQRYTCNFTQQLRPPTFFKRKSGKLFATIIFSIIASITWPLFIYIKSYSETFQKGYYQNEYSQIHLRKELREKEREKLLDEKKRLEKLLHNRENDLKRKASSLDEIYNIKSNYPMKAKIISELVYDLNHFRVQLDKIVYRNDNKEFLLYLNAKEHTNITRLLRHFTKKRLNVYKFNMNGISYNKDKKRYFSTLKVGVK